MSSGGANLAAFEARLVGPGGPFELETRPDGSMGFRHGPHTLADLYARASRLGDKRLLVDGAKAYSYAEVFARAGALRAALLREGKVAAGTRIALAIADDFDWIVSFVAVTSAGGSCVLLPRDASSAQTARLLEQASCRRALASQGHELPAGTDNLYHLLAASMGDIETWTVAVAPQSEAIVVFSSGSTGAPKGIVHSHQSLLTGHRNMMLAGALSNHMLPPSGTGQARAPNPATLVLAPLSYIAGYSAVLLAFATGGQLVLAKEDDGVDAVAQQAADHAVLSIVGASTDFLRQLIRLPDASHRLRALRRLHLHGEGLQKTLIADIETVLPDVGLMTGYGMSETGGAVAGAPVRTVLATPSGSGRRLASVRMRVVDDAGRRLSAGATGHIEVQGDMVMRGYLDARQTLPVLTADGWYRTGDVGSVDDEGWVCIADRDDGRLSGTLFRRDIEEAVRALPGVDDVALNAIPGTDRLTLFLQMRVGSAADIPSVTACVERLKLEAQRLDVRVVPALPRTVSGKVDRARLEA